MKKYFFLFLITALNSTSAQAFDVNACENKIRAEMLKIYKDSYTFNGDGEINRIVAKGEAFTTLVFRMKGYGFETEDEVVVKNSTCQVIGHETIWND